MYDRSFKTNNKYINTKKIQRMRKLCYDEKS